MGSEMCIRDSTTAVVYGVAVSTAEGDGQEIEIVTEGLINCSGASLVVEEAYFLSEDAAGDMQPSTDNAAGDYTSFLGKAPSASTFYVKILNAASVLGT